LLKSDGRASSACRQPRWAGFHLAGRPGNDPGQPQGIGFTDRSASIAEYHPWLLPLHGSKSREPGVAFASPGSLSGTVIFSITQDDYMVILPDCLLSFSWRPSNGRL